MWDYSAGPLNAPDQTKLATETVCRSIKGYEKVLHDWAHAPTQEHMLRELSTKWTSCCGVTETTSSRMLFVHETEKESRYCNKTVNYTTNSIAVEQEARPAAAGENTADAWLMVVK